jgi:hypothetical protein
LTPESIAAAYQRYEATIIPQLEKSYALTPAQVDELNENPGQLIPKLAARIHYSAQVAAYTGIMSQLPRIIEAVLGRRSEIEKVEAKFNDRWPLLKDPKYAKTVDTVIQAWRASNPNATPDDVIEKAGLMAMLSLGLNPAPPASPQSPVPPPVAPARPAGTGGSGAPRSPAAGATDPWGELAQDILETGL